MEHPLLDARAQSLVQDLAYGCENGTLRSATVAIYDTAWVPMIVKNVGGEDQWLFPQCFQFLLDNQSTEGHWQAYFSLEDGILNTLAALLAIKRHSNLVPPETDIVSSVLDVAISKAKSYLKNNLSDWDVESAILVGFEILVPALLAMLEKENIFSDFPGRHVLRTLREARLARFDPHIIYDGQTTLVYSLEAFIVEIDFDRLNDCKTFGSMMGSPASTAAYLMQSSQWDIEAEDCLRKVVEKGQGKGSGGVPSVFPMPVFEITWILSTLFQGTFSVDSLGAEHIDKIALYLQENFHKQKGLLGFDLSLYADADDTAKTILTLNYLGTQADPNQMIKFFNTKQDHFSLLSCRDVQDYSPQVLSITAFLCNSWWTGTARDKWNHSLQYSMMLLSRALMRLLELCDQGVLKLSAALLQDQVPVVLTQVANRTLLAQSNTGAWDAKGMPEAPAYGILTLAAVITLPWLAPLQEQIRSAMQEGQRSLMHSKCDWGKPQYLWIEKVTYGAQRICEACCLAALRPSTSSHVWSDQINTLVNVSEKSISKFSKLVSSLTLFQSVPLLKLKASVIEGYAFLPRLKSARMDILPRQKGAKNEYLDFIPCIWVLINNHKGLYLHANLLWDMMVLTMCNFRVDEYMETVVARLGDATLEHIKSAICTLCTRTDMKRPQTRENPHAESVRTKNGANHVQERNGTKDSSDLASFKAITDHYISAMLDYPRIQLASLSDRNHLRSELQTFLLSHVTQIEDNSRFAEQEPQSLLTTAIFASTRTSYYDWVHTIGADSVSCPFSFAFFTFLLGSALPSNSHPADCFPSIHQKYLASDLCSHLAVMSRLYNDYGSLVRDRAEANINSVNFPEFHHTHTQGRSALDGEERSTKKEAQLKAELLTLAQYERDTADSIGHKLLADLRKGSSTKDKTKANGFELFMSVTGLYADMYVARDLSNRIEKVQ